FLLWGSSNLTVFGFSSAVVHNSTSIYDLQSAIIIEVGQAIDLCNIKSAILSRKDFSLQD
ncbi:hypothetical protein, partial [Acinetobacter sp. UBA6720]|uniref:hypothetical protein n=1 Tax=Acinetobacter sp. UBA6720 TaxID=1945953 RepID=UPI0025C53A14